MKKLLVLFLFCWACSFVSAQKSYFIYLESRNAQPFYVRTTDKVYSSSSAGYLVLSNLIDSSYTLFIGFPSLQSKETKFLVPISGADRGFAISNEDGGLVLSDLQNLSLIKPVQDLAGKNVSYEARSDAFTLLLSKASGDSSLLMVPIFAKAELTRVEEKKQALDHIETIKPKTEEAKQKETDEKLKSEETKNTTSDISLLPDTAGKLKVDSSAANALQNDVANAGIKPEKVEAKGEEPVRLQNSAADSSGSTLQTEDYRKSTVKKYSESSTSEGFGLVYLDMNGERMDTIRLLIPNAKIIFRDADTTQRNDKIFLEVKKDPVQEKPLVTKGEKTDTVITTADNPASQTGEVAATTPKAKCSDQATGNDFFKLRRDMAAKQTDEAMVEEAKKYFKNKCYTTEQIKNLSVLFLTSAGKYLFFDAAYMHVSDQESFATLQSQIKDDYYLRRFKALIGE